jgi:hypothetical protein
MSKVTVFYGFIIPKNKCVKKKLDPTITQRKRKGEIPLVRPPPPSKLASCKCDSGRKDLRFSCCLSLA